MKKALLIIIAVLIVLAGMAVAAWFYLPGLAYRMLGKAIDGTVEASKSSVSFHDGLLVLKLEGVRIKGNVEGVVKTCELRVMPSRGLYVKYFAISDFTLRIGKERGHVGFYPVPVELALIRKGTVEYEGRTYVLREMRVTNFNTGGKLEFSIDGGIEGVGDLKTRGEGIFGEKRSDLQGEYSLSRVNMALVFKNYEGLADSCGHFSYRDNVLVMDGEVQAPYFSMMEDFLTHRLVSERNVCRIHLRRAGDDTDVALTGLSFKGTPVSLNFSAIRKKLTFLELKTGFITVPDLMEYINPARFAEGDWGPLSLIRSGNLAIGSFVFRRGRPIVARLQLRDIETEIGTVAFREVSGSLAVRDNALELSGFEGRWGQGRISGLTGIVPLTVDRDVRLSGRYALDIRDLARFAGTESVEVLAGTTEGDVELRGRQGSGFTIQGAGTILGSRFVWRRIALGASGRYTFRDRRVAFAPLVLEAAGTRLVMTGNAEKSQANLQVRGMVDGRQIDALLDLPYRLRGTVGVDGGGAFADGAFRAAGRLTMTDLAFEIPRVMKKQRGMESLAVVSLHGKKGGEITVDSLDYTLGPLEAALSATVGAGGVSRLHLALDVPRVEELSRLFFFDDRETRGDLKADIQVEDLPYPVTKLPTMRGYLTFRGSILHPYALVLPLTGVDLAAAFEGDRFTVDLSGLRAGKSALSKAHLVVAGLAAPHFTLGVVMDSFDAADFTGISRKRFAMPVIAAGSLADRTTGEFLLQSGRARLGGALLKDVAMKGVFEGRMLTVTEGRAEMGKGDLAFQGDVSFGPVSRIRGTGHLSDATAQEFFALFGGKQDVIEGAGSISADLAFSGKDAGELARSASGTVGLISRDGVIRKWNILSKVLALTNVSDLLRGRVDLTREGLVYRRLSASFQGHDGVFHTDNFLIDSPSMLITGAGDVDAATKKIDGEMTVSPLVTMDRIINLIPLLRNIFREKKSGFLFFVYSIKGPVDDPEIKSSYVRSMGERIIYLLRNVIELPKAFWDELHKELQR